MPKESMTPRERWLAVLQHRIPDRVPTDYWTTDEAHARLKAHMGIVDDDVLYERLHIDRPFTVGPRYVGPPLERRRGRLWHPLPHDGLWQRGLSRGCVQSSC